MLVRLKFIFLLWLIMELPLDIKKIVDMEKIKNFCINNHISRLSLFGSILTEKFNDSSDIDVLIEFELDHIPGFFGLMKLQFNLSKIFNNRKIDIRTKNDLSRYFRQEVLNQAIEIYGGR